MSQGADTLELLTIPAAKKVKYRRPVTAWEEPRTRDRHGHDCRRLWDARERISRNEPDDGEL